MADRYLIETSATDGYLLEDSSGVLILETPAAGPTDVVPRHLLTGFGPDAQAGNASRRWT